MPRINRSAVLPFVALLCGFCQAQAPSAKIEVCHLTYTPWLEDDVRWIVTPKEAAQFELAKSDEERNNFVERFWRRRDPSPNTIENEYQEELYRRVIYANEHFSNTDSPGRDTDRGHIYIRFGPPDEIKSKSINGLGGETWSYRFIEELGSATKFKFKPAGGKGLLLDGPMPANPSIIFESGWTKPAATRFKDLEEMVTHGIRYSQLSFDVKAEFTPATDDTTIVTFTVNVPRQSLKLKDDESRSRQIGRVNVYGRVQDLTGRVVGEFEDTAEISDKDGSDALAVQTIPLRPGIYRLQIAVKDLNNDEQVGTKTQSLRVTGCEGWERRR